MNAPTIGVSHPALLSGIPNPVPSLDGQPTGVRSSCDLSGCAAEVTAAGPGPNGRHRAGIGPANGWSLTCRISASQNHAFDLARTLMVPVTRFEIEGEIGIMPSADYDGDTVINQYDPLPMNWLIDRSALRKKACRLR